MPGRAKSLHIVVALPGAFSYNEENVREVTAMARLSDPITLLRGIGPARAKQFANLNIFTLEDLICHFPRGYDDRTRLVTIEQLQADVPACFRATVMNTPRTAHIRKGLDLTKVTVADATGRLNLTFFNSPFAAQQLQYGTEYVFYGAVTGDFIGYQMTNPVFEPADSPGVTTRQILPVYPLTAGLNNAAVLRAVRQALAICDPPEEVLPEPLRQKYGILPARTAYQAIHQPRSMEEAAQAKRRMVFEEFFVFSAGLSLMRAARAEKQVSPYPEVDMEPFYHALPFALTDPIFAPINYFFTPIRVIVRSLLLFLLHRLLRGLLRHEGDSHRTGTGNTRSTGSARQPAGYFAVIRLRRTVSSRRSTA